MLTIRLARGGSKKRPFYTLTVTDSRNPVTVRTSSRLVSSTLSLVARKFACPLNKTALLTG